MRSTELRCSPAQLLADYIAGGGTPSLPQANGRSLIFTESGRAAILLAARLWGICRHDEILVPAYNCGSDISPLIATGARVSMYRVDSNAYIDFADLYRRVNERTRLIHVIHYFGRPADLGDLAALCRERNIKLLEDCALSLFSENTGCVGDGAIFSFYKTLPTCAGGALALREAVLPHSQVKPPTHRQTMHGSLSLVKKWAAGSLPAMPPRPPRSHLPNEPIDVGLPSPPDIPSSYYCDPNSEVHEASRLARGALRRANVTQIVQTRRANYELLRQHLLQTKNISLLWTNDLESGTCPLGLAVLVPNKPLWCKKLNAFGIPVTSWWTGCHKGLDWSDYPEALALKAQLILLPVHQRLSAQHMEHIARTVHALAAATEHRTSLRRDNSAV